MFTCIVLIAIKITDHNVTIHNIIIRDFDGHKNNKCERESQDRNQIKYPLMLPPCYNAREIIPAFLIPTLKNISRKSYVPCFLDNLYL